MNFADYGFLRIGAVAPTIALANPRCNAQRIAEKYELLTASGCSVVLTPELSLTGYSCEDLFLTSDLRQDTSQAIVELAAITHEALLVVGAPLTLVDGRLVNAALVLGQGRILGAVPKCSNPNHAEFYEQRWFASGLGIDVTCQLTEFAFHVSANQLFRIGETYCAVEICEDLWLPQPPSAQHALQGATLILNPSASPEQVTKADYRRDLVRMQSGRCLSAYLYASSTVTESTKDVVFGGHLLAAENATMLGESELFQQESSLVVDVDWQRLQHERVSNSTFKSAPREGNYRIVGDVCRPNIQRLRRQIDKHPFVPTDIGVLNARAKTIMDIQSHGLARRLLASTSHRMVIGLSGGLDSSLALLVCIDAADSLGWSLDRILGVTMPGPGTGAHTRESVELLASAAGLALRDIPISAAVDAHLKDIQHARTDDVTFENSQARERTQILFDLANQNQGIVVGTGDLSELALGWCTFNADQMSGYNVNASIPKTLIQYLMQWYAKHKASPALGNALERVLQTPITPELLPVVDGEFTQQTEELIGPYELHDFFLYHFLRGGAHIAKIYALANIAFGDDYQPDEIRQWMSVFFTRFHQQQFKRTTMPPGPKVGTVSLSPRGDWRMPDETDWGRVLEQIDELS